MQAKDIKIGDNYAVKRNGEKSMVVTELRTSRTHNGTKNYAVGYSPHEPGAPDREKIVVEMKDVIGELREHQQLVAEAKARREKREAEEAERIDKQTRAIKLLAEFIGAKAVTGNRYAHGSGYDAEEPTVSASSRDIEINAAAVDAVLAAFEPREGDTGQAFDMHADVGLDSTYEQG